MKHAKKARSSKKWGIIIVAALALSAGILLTIRPWKSDDGLKYERDAVNGSIDSGVGDLERMQELVDRGMITMSINATPAYRISEKKAGVNWNIENPAAQSTKLIRVEIYRDDTSEKIYETGAIAPGKYVTGTRPDVELAVGEYTCTAYFYSYDIETEEYLGQAGTQIVLYVLD